VSRLRQTAAWQALEGHRVELDDTHLRELFAADPDRAKRLTLEVAGIHADLSKNLVTAETLELLLALARETGVAERREAMFRGERVNPTEDRPALHTALRMPRGESLVVDGVDLVAEVHEVLDRMAGFCRSVRSGAWLGHSGRPIRNVIHIGIGGSDLGPVMAYEALRHLASRELRIRFVSNVDGTDFSESVRDLDPAETLVIVSSKTFTTLETMANAGAARRWLLGSAGAGGGRGAPFRRHLDERR